ncbi:hypothetical protein Peur_066496 [Populus x canadensis]
MDGVCVLNLGAVLGETVKLNVMEKSNFANHYLSGHGMDLLDCIDWAPHHWELGELLEWSSKFLVLVVSVL